MRFYGLALLASAAVLGACGGGEKAADTTKAAPPAAGLSWTLPTWMRTGAMTSCLGPSAVGRKPFRSLSGFGNNGKAVRIC